MHHLEIMNEDGMFDTTEPYDFYVNTFGTPEQYASHVILTRQEDNGV